MVYQVSMCYCSAFYINTLDTLWNGNHEVCQPVVGPIRAKWVWHQLHAGSTSGVYRNPLHVLQYCGACILKQYPILHCVFRGPTCRYGSEKSLL
jgi:hypothetical protein